MRVMSASGPKADIHGVLFEPEDTLPKRTNSKAAVISAIEADVWCFVDVVGEGFLSLTKNPDQEPGLAKTAGSKTRLCRLGIRASYCPIEHVFLASSHFMPALSQSALFVGVSAAKRRSDKGNRKAQSNEHRN
jgi:hypothetical protein